jgi:anti-sigma B factor antagonist
VSFTWEERKMEITESKAGTAHVLSLSGRLDATTSSQLEKVVVERLQSGENRLLFDLSNLQYISSAGLRSLAAVLVKCRDEGGDMKLAALNERVTRVFKIIGFDLLMSVTDTPETAISEFSSGAAS